MPRGGKRKGAGRKSQWESGCSFSETTVIRVPKVLRNKLLEIAHRLDAGDNLDLDTKLLRERNVYLERQVFQLEEKLGRLLKPIANSQKKQGELELDTELTIFLSGYALGMKRFGLSKSTVARSKKDKTLEKFTQWTKERDPDGIAWKFVETPVKGYVPVDDTSSELLAVLQDWMVKNNLS